MARPLHPSPGENQSYPFRVVDRQTAVHGKSKGDAEGKDADYTSEDYE